MQWFEMPFAVLGLLAIVAVVPVWVWFVTSSPYASSLTTEARFMSLLALPALVLLYLASWFEPR